MSKTIHPLGDQSGGVNTFANERDVDDREYATGYNVDSSIPGEIRCLGKWDTFFADANYVIDEITAISQTGAGSAMLLGTTISNYTGPIGTTYYEVQCERTIPTPNTFKWKKKLNDGNWSSWSAEIDMKDDPDIAGNMDNGLRPYWANPNDSSHVGYQDDNTSYSKWTFSVGVSAFQDVKAGYGLFPFQTDFDLSGNSVAGYYLAVAKPDVASTNNVTKVSMYHQPQISSSNVTKDVISIEGSHADATLDYLWIDGAMRLFDASSTLNEHNFAPKKWWLLEKGVGYFKGSSINDKYISTNSWVTETAEPIAPTGGHMFKGTNVNRPFSVMQHTNQTEDFEWEIDTSTNPNTTAINVMATDFGLSSAGINVGLYIATADVVQGYTYNDSNIGWGKDASTAREYKFYYSYIYDNNQESLLYQYTVQNDGSDTISLGGNAAAGSGKYVTFMPIAYPGADAASWNYRITGIRLYYNRADSDNNVKYYIGEFPIQGPSAGDNTAKELDHSTARPLLLGKDANGNPNNTSGNDAYQDVGLYFEEPPVIFTHAVMSGIREDTTSIGCKYKTGTVINRRLYVGNVKQATEDSGGVEKKYTDRIVKSLPNKFDVLPDTEFIDVAIRDGEEIIKLESLGNRLLQFKQNTLYSIAVAGGEEYLDGTFKNMGASHPHAITKTDYGIFWVNKRGAYIFTGEGAPINLIDRKIGLKEWNDWITTDAITGYLPSEKKFVVINNSANVWATKDETSVVDMYIYNILTQSWNQGVNLIGTAGASLDAVSNIVNYTDSNKNVTPILMVGNDDLMQYKNVEDLDGNTVATRVFNLITKDIHAGSPHLRKKFYKAYITYKGLGNNSGALQGVIPTVKATITGSTGKNIITLVGGTVFSATDDWKTAEYKVDATSNSDKAASRNAYSVKLEISHNTVHQNFKINDISLVFRPKSVK